jgi:hypothetical protein
MRVIGFSEYARALVQELGRDSHRRQIIQVRCCINAAASVLEWSNFLKFSPL